MRDEALLKT